MKKSDDAGRPGDESPMTRKQWRDRLQIGKPAIMLREESDMSANEQQSTACRPDQAQTGELTDVERRILEGYKRDGINLVNSKLDLVRREICDTACHESAHVVAGIFTGLEDLRAFYVSIIPKEQTSGHVRSNSGILERELFDTTRTDPLRRCKAMCLLLVDLAGVCAEARIAAPDRRGKILDELALALEDEDNEDCVNAQRIAKAIVRPWMPNHRVLAHAIKWTDEMLGMPEVWNAVERLAGMLRERGTIERPDELMEACRGIHGLSFRLPKWKRRLHLVKRVPCDAADHA
jgi:hypothetical protein